MTKMKKGIYAILAMLAVFALVFTGCPGPDDNGEEEENPVGPNSNTILNYITLGGGGQATQITGSFNKDLNVIEKLAPVSVSGGVNEKGAEIELSLGSSFKGVAKIAIVGKDDDVKEKDFKITYKKGDTSYTFDDDDKLYVKLTAENKTSVMYYGFQVSVGGDATLKADGGLVFINQYVVGAQTVREQIKVDNLGTPADNVAGIEAGKYQFNVKQPDDGFFITANPNDPDATVTVGTTAAATGINIDGTAKTLIDDNSSLYIKVVSQNTKSTKFYKIDLTLKRAINLPYGTPTTLNAATAFTADTIWTEKATDWVLINRSNPTEGTGWLDLPLEQRSHGRAKLLWDGDGIWVYAEVWEAVVSAAAGEHNSSSVELFINENAAATSGDVTGNNNGNGGQYRLGANGDFSGAPSAAVSVFRALNQASAVKVADMGTYPEALNGIKTGYKLLFQAPWIYNDKDKEPYFEVKGDKALTIELQINATGPNGSRAGVLNWNNISSNSYGSLADYGDAVLKLAPNEVMGAKRPVITTQPVSQGIALNSPATAMTVAASSPEGGAISYAWFKAASATGFDAATAVAGATSATLPAASIDTSVAGSFYYFAKVTNTVTGKAPKVANSAMAGVRVYDPANPPVYTVDLSKYVSAAQVAASWENKGAAVEYSASAGLTWTFAPVAALANNGNAQVGYIKLADEVVDDLMVAKSLKVNVTATVTPDTATFRAFLALNGANSYNGTNPIGSAGVVANWTGEKAVNFNGEPDRDKLSYFLLQGRDTGGGTVNITSITITPVYE